jgi:hypothetical protein
MKSLLEYFCYFSYGVIFLIFLLMIVANGIDHRNKRR